MCLRRRRGSWALVREGQGQEGGEGQGFWGLCWEWDVYRAKRTELRGLGMRVPWEEPGWRAEGPSRPECC